MPRTTVTRVATTAAAAVLATAAIAAPAAHAGDLPTPQGGYGSYAQTYTIGTLPKYSPAQVMRQLNTNFDRYFTFSGCGASVTVGEVCRLKTIGPEAPVEVVAISSTGFALKSLAGHPEGAGRTIRFQFRVADVNGNATLKELHVNAWGPVSGSSLAGPLNANTIARQSWTTFTNNITTRFPKTPPPAGDLV